NTILSDVWVAKADGSDVQEITAGEPQGFALGWGNDRIVSVDTQAHWFTMNADGSGETPIFSERELHNQLAVCRDGKHIVYTNRREGRFEVWRADTDGANPIKLLPTPVAGILGCAPDSMSAIYVADSVFWRVPFDGGSPIKLNLPLGLADYS